MSGWVTDLSAAGRAPAAFRACLPARDGRCVILQGHVALLLREELQGGAVHAIPQAGRLGPIVEHVAQVPAAAPAVNLRARHEETPVGRGPDGPIDRRPKARPAGAAVELRVRLEQGQIAAGAGVGAPGVLLVQRARPRPLGSVLAEHPKLLGRQHRPPLGLGPGDLECFGRGHLRLRSAPAQAGSHHHTRYPHDVTHELSPRHMAPPAPSSSYTRGSRVSRLAAVTTRCRTRRSSYSSRRAITRAGADSVRHLAGSAITFTLDGIWSRLMRFSIWNVILGRIVRWTRIPLVRISSAFP